MSFIFTQYSFCDSFKHCLVSSCLYINQVKLNMLYTLIRQLVEFMLCICFEIDRVISLPYELVQTIRAPVPSEPRTGWNLFSSFLYGTRLPLGQRGATQKMDFKADLFLVFVWDKTDSGTARSNIGKGMECIFSVFLLAAPEAVSSHSKTRSRSAVRSILSLAPHCPRGSLVPYKKWGASVLRGSPYGCAGWTRLFTNVCVNK